MLVILLLKTEARMQAPNHTGLHNESLPKNKQKEVLKILMCNAYIFIMGN